jgi:hypothetical protein
VLQDDQFEIRCDYRLAEPEAICSVTREPHRCLLSQKMTRAASRRSPWSKLRMR